MTTAVVVGNPKPASRTLGTATRLACGLTGREPDLVIDLATVGPGLLDLADPGVTELAHQVAAADLVVVAGPVYKASYPGLLKLFLDRFAPTHDTGLTGLAVPLMLGAGPGHQLVPELVLRPLLTEIGALALPGLFVLDAAHDDPAATAAWLTAHRGRVRALLDHARTTSQIGVPA